MKKTIGLLAAGTLLAAAPSMALAASAGSGWAVGVNSRCSEAMPNGFVLVPCWIRWNHRAGSDW